jgi:NDP-sugar pyrophosphorylase family protein
VHVIEPALFGLLTERGKFSIVPPYLRLAAAGHAIRAFDVSEALWLEIGSLERLEEARARLSGS